MINNMKGLDLPVKYLRCDNAGENKNLQEMLVDEKLHGIRVEMTAPHTPQQNGIVDKAFQCLYQLVRTVLKQAKMEELT